MISGRVDEKRYWLFYGLFIAGFLLIVGLVTSQIYKKAESDFENQLNSDIVFLSNHIRIELEKGNDEGISDLISGWGELYINNIAKLRLISSSGHVIAEFRSDQYSKNTIIKYSEIGYGRNSKAYLEIISNIDNIKKVISNYYLFFGVILFLTIIVVGYMLRMNLIFKRNAWEMTQRNMELRKFSTVFNQSPSSIVVTDTDGIIEYVNPKFSTLTGYSEEELIGKSTKILNSGKNPSGVFTELWDTIKSGNVWRGDLLNRKKNGELYWEDAVIGPVHDENGEIENFIGIKLDISEWKKVQNDLEDHKKRLEETVAERTKDLEAKNEELKKFNNLFIGREMKIKELSLKLKELNREEEE